MHILHEGCTKESHPAFHGAGTAPVKYHFYTVDSSWSRIYRLIVAGVGHLEDIDTCVGMFISFHWSRAWNLHPVLARLTVFFSVIEGLCSFPRSSVCARTFRHTLKVLWRFGTMTPTILTSLVISPSPVAVLDSSGRYNSSRELVTGWVNVVGWFFRLVSSRQLELLFLEVQPFTAFSLQLHWTQFDSPGTHPIR